MFGKYGIWINENIIFLSLAALEADSGLLSRPVVPTQEAGSRRNGSLIQFGGRRYCPGRVELHPDLKSVNRQCLDTDILQGSVICAAQRPARKLPADEIADILFFGHR